MRVAACSLKAAKDGKDVEGVDTGWLLVEVLDWWSRTVMDGEIPGRSTITPPLVLARKDCSSGISGRHVIGRAAEAAGYIDSYTYQRGIGGCEGSVVGHRPGLSSYDRDRGVSFAKARQTSHEEKRLPGAAERRLGCGAGRKVEHGSSTHPS